MARKLKDGTDPADDPYDGALARWPRFAVGDRIEWYSPKDKGYTRLGWIVPRPPGPWQLGAWSGIYVQFDGCTERLEVRKFELRKLSAVERLARET